MGSAPSSVWIVHRITLRLLSVKPTGTPRYHHNAEAVFVRRIFGHLQTVKQKLSGYLQTCIIISGLQLYVFGGMLCSTMSVPLNLGLFEWLHPYAGGVTMLASALVSFFVTSGMKDVSNHTGRRIIKRQATKGVKSQAMLLFSFCCCLAGSKVPMPVAVQCLLV
jgi:hypothetical protein